MSIYDCAWADLSDIKFRGIKMFLLKLSCLKV